MPRNAPRLLRSVTRIREICDQSLEPRDAMIVRAALDVMLIAFHETEAKLRLQQSAVAVPLNEAP